MRPRQLDSQPGQGGDHESEAIQTLHLGSNEAAA